MCCIHPFLFYVTLIFSALAFSAILTRLAYAVTGKITQAPVLDFFVSLFTWFPWVAGGLLAGWQGIVASIVAQILFLHVFCLLDRVLRGKKGRTLTDAQSRLLGPIRNQFALLMTTPAVLAFAIVRLIEILTYPSVAWLAKMPTYKSSEWINLSRHKYDGLIGYDLVWCWYCDWMTGVWALGSEMLRNIESFWCPVRFRSPLKNENVSTDFPDVKEWAPADGTMEDAVRAFEEHYNGTEPNRWWGHPDRKKSE